MLPDECKRLCQRRTILNQRSFYPSLLYKVQYKFWEDKNRICDFSNLKDLPEIKNVSETPYIKNTRHFLRSKEKEQKEQLNFLR